MPKSHHAHEEQIALAFARFQRRFRKMLKALDRLHALDVLDRERCRHLRLILDHSRARIGLDVAEWTQQSELAECSRLDRGLRNIESKTSSK